MLHAFSGLQIDMSCLAWSAKYDTMHMTLHSQNGAFPDHLPPARHFRTQSPPFSMKLSLHSYSAVESNVCFFTSTLPFIGFSRSGHMIAIWGRRIKRCHAHTTCSSNNKWCISCFFSLIQRRKPHTKPKFAINDNRVEKVCFINKFEWPKTNWLR